MLKRVPYKRIRKNSQTGKTEEHIFTEAEVKEILRTGTVNLNNNAEWHEVTNAFVKGD